MKIIKDSNWRITLNNERKGITDYERELIVGEDTTTRELIENYTKMDNPGNRAIQAVNLVRNQDRTFTVTYITTFDSSD